MARGHASIYGIIDDIEAVAVVHNKMISGLFSVTRHIIHTLQWLARNGSPRITQTSGTPGNVPAISHFSLLALVGLEQGV